jgi:hypothetical protein
MTDYEDKAVIVRRRIAKAHVDTIKEKLKCSSCGLPHWVSPIEFHHDDHPTQPKRRIASMVNRGCSLKDIDLEISKCEAICHRCHMFLDGRLKTFIESRKIPQKQTICRRGHALSGKNLGIRTNGSRYCRQCKYEYSHDERGWPTSKIVSKCGHYVLGDNVYTAKTGYRRCLRCKIEATRRSDLRKKGKT